MMNELLEHTTTRWNQVKEFLSVPRTEAEYDSAVTLLNELIDTIGEDESHPLASFMDTLGTLIEAYEEEHYPLPEVSGATVLAFLLEEHQMVPTDLREELGSEEQVLDILGGKRELTSEQVRSLSRRFQVSPVVFQG